MISSGTRIGPYEIDSLIGSGGMGEVFSANDTRLGRKVAIKFLRKEFRESEDPLRRFLREAKAASALNHPNIITIYEIGEWQDVDYIAMEFVRGTSVRELLSERKMTLNDALEIAIQVASALVAAHSAGIIHRDIKPENIIRRPDGFVKVLDFGLAKQTLVRPEQDDIDSEATTRGAMSTIPGMIMGTASYMSPEQARGKPTDARTDIWSLGVLLYEMFTGRTPFSGETRSDLLVSILTRDPEPLSSVSSEIPSELEHIIKKTLVKERDERYQVMKDLQLDLKILQSELNSGVFKTEIMARTTIQPIDAQTQGHTLGETFGEQLRRPWAMAGIFGAILLGAAALWYLTKGPTGPDYPSTLTTSQIVTWKSDLGGDGTTRPKFSPDGKLIAYVASKNGKSSVWVKQLAGGEPFTRKEDDSSDASPIWSPDGGRIAFVSDRGGRRGIWSMPALGGSPVLLGAVERSSRLVRWSNDGAAIFYESAQNLFRLDTANGQSSQITRLDDKKIINRSISISPDEKMIAYVDRQDGQSDIWISDLNGSNGRRLTNDGFTDNDPVWHPDGNRIVYSSDRNGTKQITLAYLNGRQPVQLSLSDSDLGVADISHDGSQILYTTTKDDADLWQTAVETGKEAQVTSDIGSEFWPNVEQDGSAIVYQATRRTSLGTRLLNGLLFTQRSTGSERPAELSSDGFYPQWSPDGKKIAFLRSSSGDNSLWVISPTGGDEHAIVNRGVVFGGHSLLPFNRVQTRDFQWANDGSSIIYAANRDGLVNIWLAQIDGSGERQLTVNDDRNKLFFNPTFSTDGKTFAWLTMDISSPAARVWSVKTKNGDDERELFLAESAVRLIGWTANGEGLLIQTAGAGKDASTLPAEVEIRELGLNGRPARSIAKLKDAFFHNTILSPDSRILAVVTHTPAGDTIQTMPAAGGVLRAIASSSDPHVYFSSLAFSNDGKTIIYGRQANWQIISAINNFK
ncbi:MAG: protein kinase [Acidobacteriota bacterium]